MDTVYFTEHFSEKELKCKCGKCDYPGMDADFMEKLEIVRGLVNKPLPLNSAYRCPAHNDSVSSTGRTGPHTTRKAVDIRCSGKLAHEVLIAAAHCNFTGLGVQQRGNHGGRFIHLDTNEHDGRPWVWSY